MKRIIFDLDNTIFDSKKDSIVAYDKFIKKLDLKNISAMDIYNSFGKFELGDSFLNKKELTKFLNKDLSLNLRLKDLNLLLDFYHSEATFIERDTFDILNELKKDYELVVLTNWYLKGQIRRLKRSGIYKLFSKVFALENTKGKPHKDAFLKACHPHKLEECVIVGDNLKHDIIEPAKLGLNVIYFNPKKINSEYPSVETLKELKDVIK